jgi:hypothetical protein
MFEGHHMVGEHDPVKRWRVPLAGFVLLTALCLGCAAAPWMGDTGVAQADGGHRTWPT